MTSIKKEIMEEWEKMCKGLFIEGKFSHDMITIFLSQALTRIEEAGYQEGIKQVRYGNAGRCPRHDEALRCLGCVEELTPSEEKESVSDTNVTSKEEEECICKECQNGEICEACEDFGHQSPKKEKRGR